MAYRVDFTARAARDLRRLYHTIDGAKSPQAHAWFNELERLVLSLDEHPARGAILPDDSGLRQLLYGGRPNVYRVIYEIDEINQAVRIAHIRHGRHDAFIQERGS